MKGPSKIRISACDGVVRSPEKRRQSLDDSTAPTVCSLEQSISDGLSLRSKVCFAREKDGRVKCQYVEPEPPLSVEERALVWFTAEEYQAFRRDFKQQTREAQSLPQFLQDFHFVLQACNHHSLFQQTRCTSEHGTRGSLSTPAIPHVDVTAVDQCTKIVTNPYRGLELSLCAPLRRQRRRTLQTIAQLPVDDALAPKCLIMTRRSRNLARILGASDYQAAYQVPPRMIV